MLNPETGKHQLQFVRPGDAPRAVAGFASYEPVWLLGRRFYAVYGYKDRLIFQVGGRRCDLTEGKVEVEFKVFGRGLASSLAVRHKGVVIHRGTFIHPLRALSTLDPTYDGMDAEAEFFFIFLRGQLPDEQWKKRLRSVAA